MYVKMKPLIRWKKVDLNYTMRYSLEYESNYHRIFYKMKAHSNIRISSSNGATTTAFRKYLNGSFNIMRIIKKKLNDIKNLCVILTFKLVNRRQHIRILFC